jgi:hypothetical protein
MKMTFRTVAIAASTVAFAALFSPGWSEQDGLSLSIKKAEAAARVYIRGGLVGGSDSGIYSRWEGVPWYAVRAYYVGGPWSGPGYSYSGWDDYAARNGIGCRPGTLVKGGDGIDYNCQ